MCSLESDMTFTGDFVIATLADLPGRATMQRRAGVGSGSQASCVTSVAGTDQLNSSVLDQERASSAAARYTTLEHLCHLCLNSAFLNIVDGMSVYS